MSTAPLGAGSAAAPQAALVFPFRAGLAWAAAINVTEAAGGWDGEGDSDGNRDGGRDRDGGHADTPPCLLPTVIRGSIRSISNDVELQESIIGVSAARIHRQKFPLFQTGGRLAGSIRTPLRCGVKPGPGTFLFTGWLHFGEAWLSCAPRYRDFQRIYEGARRTHQNPCEFPVD